MNERRGLSLLEVLVALALMGSVLVSSLLAFSRHRRQLSIASKRIEATVAADQLVSRFASRRDGVPVRTRGSIDGKPGWIWQTSLIGTTTLANVPMRVVRVEVFEIRPTLTRLISVDLVKAAEAP
jgi:prepilin-type N-terminal cleavage/methylation domain-containing protein